MPPRTRTQQFSCSTLSLLLCTFFCAFKTCVSCITFFLGLAASHSSKDPPSLAWQHHILRRTLLPWPIDYLHLPNWSVCAGVVGVALSAKKKQLSYFSQRCSVVDKLLETSGELPSVRDERRVRGKSAKTRGARRPIRMWKWTWGLCDLGRARGCCKAVTARLPVHCKTCTVSVARTKWKWFITRGLPPLNAIRLRFRIKVWERVFLVAKSEGWNESAARLGQSWVQCPHSEWTGRRERLMPFYMNAYQL